MNTKAANPLGVDTTTALAGRDTPIQIDATHFVNHSDMMAKPENHCEQVLFAMGCFWGAERLFWQIEGIISTAVGFSGGFTPNPTYDEVCTGKTGHTEVVKVVFDPNIISFEQLLTKFWENHDPTQGMRQGGDIGTQYRSAIFTYNNAQQSSAIASKSAYQQALNAEKHHSITTEIESAKAFYFAENYHQQYLAKNPDGYCGLGGTGVCFI
jgi:peptide-methionine (S)-S-oxide reductase